MEEIREEQEEKELYTEVEEGHYKANLLENISYGGSYDYEPVVTEIDEENGILYYQEQEVHREDKLNLLQDLYTSDHFVDTTDNTERLVDLVKEEFTNIIKEPTQEQLYFVEETVRIMLGDSKISKSDNLFFDKKEPISVVTASCGMGKSVVKKAVLKVIQEEIRAGRRSDGVVVVADRFDDINDTIFNKDKDGNLVEYLDPNYYFVMKSWDRDICLNKEIKESGYKICKDCKFDQCPLQKQNKEQKQRPFVFMTNARIAELGEGLKHYKEYGNGKERTLLFIDERPQLADTMAINITLMNDIKNYISDKIKYDCLEDRYDFKDLFSQVYDRIENFMIDCNKRYCDKDKNKDKNDKQHGIREIATVFIGEDEDLTSDDERWKELCKKYKLYNKFSKELQHIQRVLRHGGLYVCEGNVEFIQSLGKKYVSKNYEEYRTIIFDGTANIDMHYSSIRKYSKSLYVPNSRTYENVHIYNFTNYNLSKSSILNSNYKIDAINDFLRKLPSYFPNQKIYAVCHKDFVIPTSNNTDVYVADDNYIKDKNGRLYYFGNTKGKNDMRDCNVMVMLGWNIKPDYTYAIQFLNHYEDPLNLLKECADDEGLRRKYSDGVNRTWRYLNGTNRALTKKEKNNLIGYDFNNIYRIEELYGIKEINETRWLDIMTEFYQEIHRTKMRVYNSKEDIYIITFNMENQIKQMTKQLLPKVDFNDLVDVTISAFDYAKTMARKTADGKMNNVQLVLDYLRSHDEVILKDVKEKFKLGKGQWSNIKRNEAIISELAKFDEVRKGNTRILIRKQ